MIKNIRFIFKDKNYPILIDQEGGKVSRLNKIINLNFFSQDFFGKLYNNDKKLSFSEFKIFLESKISKFKSREAIVNDDAGKKFYEIIDLPRLYHL